MQRICLSGGIVGHAPQGEAFHETLMRTGEITLAPSEAASPVERFRSVRGLSVFACRDRGAEGLAAFTQITAYLPEAPKCAGQNDPERAVVLCFAILQRGAQIIVIQLQSIQPFSLIRVASRTLKVRFRRFRERQKEVHMSAPNRW